MARLHDKMFVAQSTLESWIDSGKAEFDGELVTLKSHAKVYRLEPAVRFESVVEGTDAPELLGKVITEKQVGELGGELLEDSVMFGEHAFQVRAGYIAVLRDAGVG
jgi:hypothetical protein